MQEQRHDPVLTDEHRVECSGDLVEQHEHRRGDQCPGDRYPLLLVDRVLEWEPGKRIVALKNVSVNEPMFQGHFPGDPVMPAVLQIEAMAQTGAIMLMTNPDNKGLVPYFMSMDKARFRRPIRPGDQMRIEVETLRVRSRMAACLARVTVEGQLCAEAEIRSVLIDRANP